MRHRLFYAPLTGSFGSLPSALGRNFPVSATTHPTNFLRRCRSMVELERNCPNNGEFIEHLELPWSRKVREAS